MKLYDLSIDIRQLDNIDDPEQLKAEAEKLVGDFKQKAISLAKYCKELEADQVAIDAEIKRLTDLKRTKVNKTEFFKQYLFENMIATGIEKIDDTIIKLSIRTNPPSCGEIPDVMALPEQYRKLIPESWVADKTAILKQFNATGEMICQIITDKKRLEIK